MRATVAGLLETPHLQLRLLAGASGTDRVVGWAHASDLETPWEFLAGGELLMRNGRTLPRSAPRQRAFLQALADAGAAGCVIGEDPDTPRLHPQAAEAADSLRFPVLAVPYSVGFVAIAVAVVDANAGHDTMRLARIERIYRAAREVMAGRSTDPMTARLRRELDCGLMLVDAATGRPVGDYPDDLAAVTGSAVRAAVAAYPSGLPAVLHGRFPDGRDLLVVDVPAEEPTVLAVFDVRGEPPDAVLLQHLATAAAVDVAREAMLLEHRRRLGAELLAHLFQGRIDDAAGDLHDLPPGDAVLLAVRGARTEDWGSLHVALARRRLPALLLSRNDVGLALLPDTPEAVAVVRDRLDAGTDGNVTIGLSRPLGTAERTPAARREALWALGLAAGRPARTARYGDASARSMLHGPDEAQALVDRVIGPVIAYDREHGTELVRTLSVYLRQRRSWQRTSDALNVHKQTVVYRMQRVEQLTGLTLAETAHLAELWTAVQAYDILREIGPQD
ncbi:PucR family transcriptional regulator [Uniformispora flossi]|uniref:PucR family transcriptional regulator n=1 Tax=Uniformispora flossi TaxID=3390723 RepID=UPI003C2B2214